MNKNSHSFTSLEKGKTKTYFMNSEFNSNSSSIYSKNNNNKGLDLKSPPLNTKNLNSYNYNNNFSTFNSTNRTNYNSLGSNYLNSINCRNKPNNEKNKYNNDFFGTINASNINLNLNSTTFKRINSSDNKNSLHKNSLFRVESPQSNKFNSNNNGNTNNINIRNKYNPDFFYTKITDEPSLALKTSVRSTYVSPNRIHAYVIGSKPSSFLSSTENNNNMSKRIISYSSRINSANNSVNKLKTISSPYNSTIINQKFSLNKANSPSKLEAFSESLNLKARVNSITKTKSELLDLNRKDLFTLAAADNNKAKNYAMKLQLNKLSSELQSNKTNNTFNNNKADLNLFKKKLEISNNTTNLKNNFNLKDNLTENILESFRFKTNLNRNSFNKSNMNGINNIDNIRDDIMFNNKSKLNFSERRVELLNSIKSNNSNANSGKVKLINNKSSLEKEYKQTNSNKLFDNYYNDKFSFLNKAKINEDNSSPHKSLSLRQLGKTLENSKRDICNYVNSISKTNNLNNNSNTLVNNKLEFNGTFDRMNKIKNKL